MASSTVSILEGNTFIVSDLAGNINATPTDPLGLFAWDTRFLSKWILTINGTVPNVLSTDDLQYYLAQFFLVPGTGTIYVDSDVSIIRRRAAGAGFQEEIIIRNEKPDPTDLQVRLEAGADFADLFEVKDQLRKKGELYQRVFKGHIQARNLDHQQRSGRDGPPRAVLHGASWTTRGMAYDD